MAYMRRLLLLPITLLTSIAVCRAQQAQQPLLRGLYNDSPVDNALFWELEQLARIVDISYCVGTAGFGIQKPFSCASRCADRDFGAFELVTAWNTGPFLDDSCGYIALDHSPRSPRLILAFRGTYSIANTIVDLSTVAQEYVPYPGNDEDQLPNDAFKLQIPDGDTTPLSGPPKCENCTVHMGFYSSWLNTRKVVLPHITQALTKYPNYKLVLVGHSLGGAVATLAGLDFKARGWEPYLTTFGEPRLGNQELNAYINHQFNITGDHKNNAFHRVTHAGDPIPLLPLAEWGYYMHSEEIFAADNDLPYSVANVRFCDGDEDPNCIAGSDNDEPKWGLPTRFKFWQLLFAHRDYFWRLGLCAPGGDSKDWYSNFPRHHMNIDEDEVKENIEL